MDIVKLLKEGSENAVTRAELMRLTGFSDRKVRRLITEARLNKQPIINTQNGKGYFLSRDIPLLKAQIALNRSRYSSEITQTQILVEIVNELESKQMKLGSV